MDEKKTGTIGTLSRESLKGLTETLSGAFTMLVMRAPHDEERMAFQNQSQRREFLDRVRIAVKNSLLLHYGVSAEIAPSIAEAYTKALTFRMENKRHLSTSRISDDEDDDEAASEPARHLH